MKIILIIIGILVGIELILLYTSTSGLKQFGTYPSGLHLEKIKASPQYDGEKFVNLQPVSMSFSFSEYMIMIKRWLMDGGGRTPDVDIPVQTLTRENFDDHSGNGVHVTWLAHSTLLIEIDGYTILTDPVWSERTSPSSIMGPKRFHQMPIPLEELPKLDAVIISHDHYDHLDMTTVQTLAESGTLFVTTLGVGSHLNGWGIDTGQIIELDWWQEHHLGSDFSLICTPARHFSGRSWVRSGNKTLWSTWVIKSEKHRVFFCGDTGETPEIADIGKKYGPFDITLMKIGAYGDLWPDIHLTPRQSVRLHEQLNGKLFLPIHYGSFDLAFHPWREPLDSLMTAASEHITKLVVPYPGQRFNINNPPPLAYWWQSPQNP